MKKIAFDQQSFVPAGHEDPKAPGVLKKVLAVKDDLQVGRIQMVNWAMLPAGNRFARHYHEDMQEIFVVVEGDVQMSVGQQTFPMSRGDAIIIDARETHEMHNPSDKAAHYLAIGITSEQDGRTVVVEDV